MALPPVLRVLAVLTMGVFCFMIVQIFRAPSSIKSPVDDKSRFDDMVRDPNLDRTRSSNSQDIVHSN